MKCNWMAIGLISIAMGGLTSTAAFNTVLDRPTLFMEMLQQNEQLSKSAVSFMQRYLENPTAKDLAELKSLFRKMIGDSERKYLASNGFSVDDFINSLDAIAQMPEKERNDFLSELEKKSYTTALNLLSAHDKTLVVGREVIPLSDGNGKPIEPTNAKMDFEKMLRGTYEKSSGKNILNHWSVPHVKWIAQKKNLDEATLLLNNPLQTISQKEFASLLETCFEDCHEVAKKATEKPITRMEAMQQLYAALKLSASTEAAKAISFTDIKNLSAKEQQCIQALVQQEIVKGYADGMLKPNQELSYGEAWTMIRKALD